MVVCIINDQPVIIANVFTPNGDGINEYLIANQTYISEYSINVICYSGTPELVYSASDVEVYRNGVINLWDGTGAYYTGPYGVEIEYKDCEGTEHSYTRYPVYCFW